MEVWIHVVGCGQILDVSKAESTGFADSLKVECEEK